LHDGKLALCGTLSEIKERHRLHGFILEFENEEAASCFENTEELKQPSISPVTGWKHGKGVYERWRYGRAFFVGCAIAKAYCSVEIRSDGTDFGKFVYGGGSVKGYFAFLKKEFFEYTKTYKLFIMLMIFIIFGITNPLIAKLMPEIVGSLVTDGVVITLPEPTAYDAWAQFFKNATQMGLFVMVILFSGVLSSELSKRHPYQFADKRIVQNSGHSFKIHLHGFGMDDKYLSVLRTDLWLYGVSFPTR